MTTYILLYNSIAMFINSRHGGISCHTLSIKCLLIRPDSPTVKVEKPSINILWWQKVISNYCANNLTVTQGLCNIVLFLLNQI